MKNFLKNRMNKAKGGFTILEMLVAIAIFSVVMTMAMESILNINDAQKKIESFRTVSDNLNFALDAMSREIRTGYSYSLIASDTFSFTNAKTESVTYQLIGGQLIRSVGASAFPLTDSKITIDYLDFILSGAGASDGFQPLVRINVSASSGVKDKERSRINLQTSVSQLTPDS